ncbi:MAG: Holliday junction resolvase RuvX [Gemmatales bacterium]
MNDPSVAPPLPPGPLLGIDFGTVRVGLAICDRDQKMAFPLMILQRQNTQQEAEFYVDLVKKERITGIIIGLPIHLSGTESPKSKQVRQYGNWLTKTTGLPIAYCDERFTSAFAWDELKAGGLESLAAEETTRQGRGSDDAADLSRFAPKPDH